MTAPQSAPIAIAETSADPTPDSPTDTTSSQVLVARRATRGRLLLRWAPYWVPGVLLSLVFLLYPIVDTFRLSFSDWGGFGPSRWTGLDNYRRLASDGLFARSLGRSLVFATLGSVLTVGIGTAIAMMFDQRVAGRRVFQFLIFMPVILPVTFIATAWSSGFAPYTGWATWFLARLDPVTGENVLGSGFALYAVVAVAVLQNTGFPMIVVLGALSKVAPEIHEAATLDGVTGWQRARYVSLPMVRDVVATMTLLNWVFFFSSFEYIFVMTRGGPGTATHVTSTFIYSRAFQGRDFGYASSAAVVTALIVAAVIMTYLAAFKPRGVERAG